MQKKLNAINFGTACICSIQLKWRVVWGIPKSRATGHGWRGWCEGLGFYGARL